MQSKERRRLVGKFPTANGASHSPRGSRIVRRTANSSDGEHGAGLLAGKTSENQTMKKISLILMTVGLMALTPACSTTASSVSAVTPPPVTAPKSVIHVVTVAWKAGTTPEQIKAALDGVQGLPAKFKGLTRVWTNPLKVQNAAGANVKKTHVFVMEFADEAAFKAYTDSPEQLEWYKTYLPIREQSTTFDITN